MKKLLLPLMGILLFSACQKQILNEKIPDAMSIGTSNNVGKINVCHKDEYGSWHTVNISINAWPAHQAHGDVRLDDQDGDGFVPDNACAFGRMGDCNDNNAAINPGAAEICNNGIDENCNGKIDENCFPSVTICNQIWMQKNLDVTTYRNGDAIPQVTDPEKWANLTTGAWCYYNNDPANGVVYGKLYNFYAVIDPRGLAPAGWHVPTGWYIPGDAEWTTLINCLGGEGTAGGAIKEIGSAHWFEPNTGATNSSGFTGLPAGWRNGDGGAFNDLGGGGYWWSSTAFVTGYAWYRGVFSGSAYLTNGVDYFTTGRSVRCLKD